MPPRTQRLEFSTVGFDADLQLVGSDALRGDGWTGIAVPAARPLTVDARYTFLLATAQFGAGSYATLVGIRQLVEIGCSVSTFGDQGYPLKRLVETPTWRFVDGNVMWALRQLSPTGPYYHSQDSDGLKWEVASAPAQLFESLPPGLPILPPYRGVLQGEPVTADLAQFYDVRFPWVDDEAAEALSVPIVGPCTIGLFASVLQTDPETRLVLPGTPGTFTVESGIVPEDVFVGNNPFSGGTNTGARYTRLAGSLIFQQEVDLRGVGRRCPACRGPIGNTRDERGIDHEHQH